MPASGDYDKERCAYGIKPSLCSAVVEECSYCAMRARLAALEHAAEKAQKALRSCGHSWRWDREREESVLDCGCVEALAALAAAGMGDQGGYEDPGEDDPGLSPEDAKAHAEEVRRIAAEQGFPLSDWKPRTGDQGKDGA